MASCKHLNGHSRRSILSDSSVRTPNHGGNRKRYACSGPHQRSICISAISGVRLGLRNASSIQANFAAVEDGAGAVFVSFSSYVRTSFSPQISTVDCARRIRSTARTGAERVAAALPAPTDVCSAGTALRASGGAPSQSPASHFPWGTSETWDRNDPASPRSVRKVRCDHRFGADVNVPHRRPVARASHPAGKGTEDPEFEESARRGCMRQLPASAPQLRCEPTMWTVCDVGEAGVYSLPELTSKPGTDRGTS